MRSIIVLFALTCVSPNDADAGPFRRRAQVTETTTHAQVTQTCPGGVCPVSTTTDVTTVSTVGTNRFSAPTINGTTTVTVSSNGAIDVVNAQRAARGLRPFLHDPLLTEAAERAASNRASRLLFGHTENDFAFLSGTRALAAGCAAYPREYGFMACCVYENYTYAGAAWVQGRDGRMFCHIFVR